MSVANTKIFISLYCMCIFGQNLRVKTLLFPIYINAFSFLMNGASQEAMANEYQSL